MPSITLTVTAENGAIITQAFQAIEGKAAKDAIVDYIRNTVKNYLRTQKKAELTESVKTTLGVATLDEEKQRALNEFLSKDAQVTGIVFEPEAV